MGLHSPDMGSKFWLARGLSKRRTRRLSCCNIAEISGGCGTRKRPANQSARAAIRRAGLHDRTLQPSPDQSNSMDLVSIPANPVPEDAVTGTIKTRDGVGIRFAR